VIEGKRPSRQKHILDEGNTEIEAVSISVPAGVFPARFDFNRATAHTDPLKSILNG
jgi:hypothetical protein